MVDWAYKIDPLRCISMHGITERYLSGQKADAAGFVRLLLGDLESRISLQFSRVSFSFTLTLIKYCLHSDIYDINLRILPIAFQFVDEACHQIERNERNVRQMGVLSYIPRYLNVRLL